MVWTQVKSEVSNCPALWIKRGSEYRSLSLLHVHIGWSLDNCLWLLALEAAEERKRHTCLRVSFPVWLLSACKCKRFIRQLAWDLRFKYTSFLRSSSFPLLHLQSPQSSDRKWQQIHQVSDQSPRFLFKQDPQPGCVSRRVTERPGGASEFLYYNYYSE